VGRAAQRQTRPGAGGRSPAAAAHDRRQRGARHRLGAGSPSVDAAEVSGGQAHAGRPVFAGEPIPVPLGLLQTSLFQLATRSPKAALPNPAEHIKAAIADGTMEAGSLLTASLARNQDAIRTGSVHRGLPRSGLAGGRARNHALCLRAAAVRVCATFGAWLMAPAKISTSRRRATAGITAIVRRAVRGRPWRSALIAAACFAARSAPSPELNTYACIYCAEAGQPFVTAAPDEERKDRRVEICGACQGYLKTIDLPALSPFPLVRRRGQETMDLDLAAMEHGYGRPPLKEFTRK